MRADEPGELIAATRAAWEGVAYRIAPGPFSFAGLGVALAPGLCADGWRSEGAARVRLVLRPGLLHVMFIRGADLRLRGWGVADEAMAVTVGRATMVLSTNGCASGLGLTVAALPTDADALLAQWHGRGRDGTVLLPVSGEAALRLRDRLLRLTGEDPQGEDAEAAETALRRDMLAALQAAVGTPDLRAAQSGKRRHALAAAAEDLIWNRVRSTVPGDTSLDALCTALGTTRRTLQLAFQEHFGVNFGLVTRAARLHRVRDELRAGVASVSDTAFRHGFEHLGRFAGYYRAFYGENPSDTRRAGAR